MSTHRLPPDHQDRLAAIHARGVNVIADAGAGTGKTTLVVARLVEMVAPADDARDAVSLARIAAITFTRKAAGELRLRVREALLRELARTGLTALRRERLSDALARLDTSHIGTIHSFADRLLRLRPVEARLSPTYDIVEDETGLVDETFALFLQAVESGTLASELRGTSGEAIAAQAESTIVDALRAGIRVETQSFDFHERAGLDRLFQRLVLTRDVQAKVPQPRKPELARFRELVDELAELARAATGPHEGARFLARAARRLAARRDEADPIAILRELVSIERGMKNFRKGKEFGGDEAAWKAWRKFSGAGTGAPLREPPLFDELVRPFARWMGRRLVATGPAVVAMYEKVKARHRTVDQVDLLLCLRDLLRNRPDVRAGYQALFDHVFVDEFQDTDPLQAEIVLFLCEAGATAASWQDVAVAPGKLTIVGDPKQSIYRFRRADIAMYAAVRELVERGPHLVAKLRANFRCEPELIDWLNDRFDRILGHAEEGKQVFDRAEGTVLNERLLAGREGTRAPRVEVLPLAIDGKKNKGRYRQAEARALPAWLRRTVEGRTHEIVDPSTRERRPLRYGDVAILASATSQLPLLFPELDAAGIPYAARGGQLFLDDPLHRQFLLALRGIADRDDGIAQAALFRAPCFAVDYDDLARARAADEGSAHEGVRRARAAQALVADLRMRRLERSPGATARELLERTGFARAAALGPNGAQRLDALRELCLALDQVAADEALDFDGATARLRAWAVDPVQLDPPRPVGTDAVQILTVHQSKGLEFPVVVLWDACANLAARDERTPFTIDRDGTAWALDLDGVSWAEPEDEDIAGRELKYLHAQKRRLVYVAATRARDLLVLPVAGEPDPAWINGCLVANAPPNSMRTLDPYKVGAEPAWATELPAPSRPAPGDGAPLARAVEEEWVPAVRAAAAPRFAPTAVSSEAHRAMDERDEEAGRPRPARTSRFGPVFGETVHRAIGIALADPRLAPRDAVARAATVTGLAERRAEAEEDVARALDALAAAGLRRAPGADLQLEYPVALAADGKLLSGYVDLLAAAGDRVVTVIDFKTDAPPDGELAATHPAYVEQVRSYGRILKELGIAREVRGGLLFTAEREIRWI